MFVPQRMYEPYTLADRDRYIQRVTLSPPIIFMVDGPFEWGLPVADALKGDVRRLRDKDDFVFEDSGPSVSVRIQVRWILPKIVSVSDPRRYSGRDTAPTPARFLPETFVRRKAPSLEGDW